MGHLLFVRQSERINPDLFEILYTPADLNVFSRKISNMLNHFWDR